MSESEKSEVPGSSTNPRPVRKSGYPSHFMTCVEPLRNYGVYKDLLDLLPSLPKGWTTEELEVFIKCFSQALKANTPVDDEVWREISKNAANISSNPSLFTVNNCIRVAESIKSYVTQKGRSHDDSGGFCEEVKHLLVYLPSSDPKLADWSPSRSPKKKGGSMNSDLGSKGVVGYSSVSEADKKVDIDNLILSLVIQNFDSFKPTANLSALWAEISAQIVGLPGMSSFDVRNHLENLKKNIIDQANLEKDLQLRNDKFLFLCKDYLQIGSVHLESDDLTEKMALRSGRSAKKPRTFDVRKSLEIESLHSTTNKDCSIEPNHPNCSSTTKHQSKRAMTDPEVNLEPVNLTVKMTSRICRSPKKFQALDLPVDRLLEVEVNELSAVSLQAATRKKSNEHINTLEKERGASKSKAEELSTRAESIRAMKEPKVNSEPVNLTVKTISRRSRQPKKQKILEVGVGKVLEVDSNGLCNISLQPSSIKEPNKWSNAPEKRSCASKARGEVLRNRAESRGIMTGTEMSLDAIKVAYEAPPRRGRPPKKQKVFDDRRASVEMIGLNAASLLPTAFKEPKARETQNSAFAVYVEALEGLRTRIPSCRDSKNRMTGMENLRFSGQNVIEATACLGPNVEVVRHPNIFNDFCAKSKMLAQFCQGTFNSTEQEENSTHLLSSRNVKYNMIPSERTYTEEETYSNKKRRRMDKNSTKTHLITTPEKVSVFALSETLPSPYLYSINNCTKNMTDFAGASTRTRRRCLEYNNSKVVPSSENKAISKGMNLVNFFNFQKEDQMRSKEFNSEQKKTFTEHKTKTQNLPSREAQSHALSPNRALDDNLVTVQTDVDNMKHKIHDKNSIITVGSVSGSREANISVLSSRNPRRAMSRHDKTGNRKNLPSCHEVDQGVIFVKPPPKSEVLDIGKVVEDVTPHDICSDEVGNINRRILLRRRKMALQPDNSNSVARRNTQAALFGLSQNEMLITGSEVKNQKAVTPHPPVTLISPKSSAKMYDIAQPETIDAASHPNGKATTLNWNLNQSAPCSTEVSIRKLRPRESRSNEVTSNNKMTSPTQFSSETSDNAEVRLEVLAVGRKQNKLEDKYSLEIASNSLVTPPSSVAKLASSVRTDSQMVPIHQEKGRMEIIEQCALNDAKVISERRETSNMNPPGNRRSFDQKSGLLTSTGTKSSVSISNLGKHSIQNIISPNQPALEVVINYENNRNEYSPDAQTNVGGKTTSKKRSKGSLNNEFPNENIELALETCESNLIGSSTTTQCQEMVTLSPFADQLLYIETDSESNYRRSNNEPYGDKAVSTTPEKKKKKSLEEISNDLLKKSSSRLLPPRNVQSEVFTSNDITTQNNVVPDNSSYFNVESLAQNNTTGSTDILLEITAMSAMDDIKTSIGNDKNSLEDNYFDILEVKNNLRVLTPSEAKNKVLTSRTESTDRNNVVPNVRNESSETETENISKVIVVEVAAITAEDDLETSVTHSKKGVEKILNDIEVESNYRVLPRREAKNKVLTSRTESTDRIKVVPIVRNESSETETENTFKDVVEVATIIAEDDLETSVTNSKKGVEKISNDIEVESNYRVLPRREAKNKVLTSRTESTDRNKVVPIVRNESSEMETENTSKDIVVEVATIVAEDDLETSVTNSKKGVEKILNDIEVESNSRVLPRREAKNKVLTSRTESTDRNKVVPIVQNESSETETENTSKDIVVEVATIIAEDDLETSVTNSKKGVEKILNDIEVESNYRVLPPREAKNKVLTSSTESADRNKVVPSVRNESSENISGHTEDVVEVAVIIAKDDLETSVTNSEKGFEKISSDIEVESNYRVLPPTETKNKVLTSSTESADRNKVVSCVSNKSSENTRATSKDIYVEVAADELGTSVGENVELNSIDIEERGTSRILPPRNARNKVLISSAETTNHNKVVPVVPQKCPESRACSEDIVVDKTVITASDDLDTSVRKSTKQNSHDIETKSSTRVLLPRNAKTKALTSTAPTNQNIVPPVHTKDIFIEVAAIATSDDLEASVGRNVEKSSNDIEVKSKSRVLPPREAKNKMLTSSTESTYQKSNVLFVLDKSSENISDRTEGLIVEVAAITATDDFETSVRKNTSNPEQNSDIQAKSSSRVLLPKKAKNKVLTSTAPTNQNIVPPVPEKSSENTWALTKDIFIEVAAITTSDDLEASVGRNDKSVEKSSNDIEVKSKSRVLPPREAKNKMLISSTESTNQKSNALIVLDKSSENTSARTEGLIVEDAAISATDDFETSVRESTKNVEQNSNGIEVKSSFRVLPSRNAKTKVHTLSIASTDQNKIVPALPEKISKEAPIKNISVEVAAFTTKDDSENTNRNNKKSVELSSNNIEVESNSRVLLPREAKNKVLTSSTESTDQNKVVPIVRNKSSENIIGHIEDVVEVAAIIAEENSDTLVGKNKKCVEQSFNNIEVKSNSRVLPPREAKNKVLTSTTDQNKVVPIVRNKNSENIIEHIEDVVEVAAIIAEENTDTLVGKNKKCVEQSFNNIEVKSNSRVFPPREAKNKVLTSTTDQNKVVPIVRNKNSENIIEHIEDVVEVAAIIAEENTDTLVGKNKKCVEQSFNNIEVKSNSRVLPPREAKNKVLTSRTESTDQNKVPSVSNKSSENTRATSKDIYVEVAADELETSVGENVELVSIDIEERGTSRILLPRNARNKVLISSAKNKELTLNIASIDQNKIVPALPEKISKNTRAPIEDISVEVAAFTTKDDSENSIRRNKKIVELSSNNIEAKSKSRVLPSREAKYKMLPANTESTNQNKVVPFVPNKSSENTSANTTIRENKSVEQSSNDIEVKSNSRVLSRRNAKNKVITLSTESLNQNSTIPVVADKNWGNRAHTKAIVVEVAAVTAKDELDISVGKNKKGCEQTSGDIEVKSLFRVLPPRNAKNKVMTPSTESSNLSSSVPVVSDKSSQNTRPPKDILFEVAPFTVENDLETSLQKNKRSVDQISNNTEVKSSFRVLPPRNAKNKVYMTLSSEPLTLNVPVNSSEFKGESVTRQSSKDTFVEEATVTAKDVLEIPVGKHKKGLEQTSNDIEMKTNSRTLPSRDAKNNVVKSRKKSTIQNKIVPVVTENSCGFSVSKQNTRASTKDILNGITPRSIVESNIEENKCHVKEKLTSGKFRNSNQIPDKKVNNQLTVPIATCGSTEGDKSQRETEINSGIIQTHSVLNDMEKMVPPKCSDETATSENNLSNSVLLSNENGNKQLPLSSEATKKNMASSEKTHIESIIQEKTSDGVFKIPGPFYKVLKRRKCTSQGVPTREIQNRRLPGRKCASRVLPTCETKYKNVKAVKPKDTPTTEDETRNGNFQKKSFLSTSNKKDVDRIPNNAACLKPVLHKQLKTVEKKTRSVATSNIVHDPSNDLIATSDNIVASCIRKENIVEDIQHHTEMKSKLYFPRIYLKKSQLSKLNENITEVDIRNNCNIAENTDFMSAKVNSSPEEATTELPDSVGDIQSSCSDETSQKLKRRGRPPKNNIIARKQSKPTNDHILKRHLKTMFPDGIVKYPVVQLVDLKYSHKLKKEGDIYDFVVNIKESKNNDTVDLNRLAGRTRSFRSKEIVKNRQCSLKKLRVSHPVIQKKKDGRTKGTATKLQCNSNFTDNLTDISSSIQERKAGVSLPSQKNEQLVEVKSQEKLVESLMNKPDGTVPTSLNGKKLGGSSSVKDLRAKSIQSTTVRGVRPESSTHTRVPDPKKQQFKGSQTTSKKNKVDFESFSQYSSTCSQTTRLAQAGLRFDQPVLDQLGGLRKTTTVVGVSETSGAVVRAQTTSSMQEVPTPGVFQTAREQFGDPRKTTSVVGVSETSRAEVVSGLSRAQTTSSMQEVPTPGVFQTAREQFGDPRKTTSVVGVSETSRAEVVSGLSRAQTTSSMQEVPTPGVFQTSREQFGDPRKTTSVVGVSETSRAEVVTGLSRAQATSSMQGRPTPGVSERSRAQFVDQVSNSNVDQPPMMGTWQRGLRESQIYNIFQELHQGRGGLSGLGAFRETSLPGGSAQMAGSSLGGPFFGLPPRAGPSSGSDMNYSLNRGRYEPNNQYDLQHMRLPPIWLQHILKEFEKSENWKLRHIVSASNELLNLEIRRNLALDNILEFVTKKHE